MPPAAKKDCGLVMFDLGSSQKAELLNGLIKFSTFKWFMKSKSIYRLILVNSAETSNDLNYPNIFTTEIDDFDPKLITQTIEGASTGKANWIDALLLGIHHLEEAIEMRGLITLQLIFFTTLDMGNTLIDQTKFQTIVEKLNQHNMFLYIIGPNIELPFTLTSLNSIPKCMKELQVETGNHNIVSANKLVQNVKNGIMCNTKIGVNLLISFKNSQGSQPWKVPFTFGTKLSIPAVTTKLYRKDISLKMFSPVPRKFAKTLSDQRSVVVDESNIVKVIVRHGKFIKVEDEMFRSETERCFEIIGFTHKKFVPETLLRGEDTFYVLPNEFSNDGFQIFIHLVKILHESEKYAISKRVYANNNKARYFVLIPNVEHDPKCFTMTGLPYYDFLTPHKCAVPLAPKEKIKQDEFFRFFKSLIVDSKESKAGITLGPTLMIDFSQQKIINAVAKKYLQNDNLNIESLDIDDYEVPPSNKFLETLRQSWPFRSVESPSKH